MRFAAVSLVLMALVTAVGTAIAVIHSALLTNGPYRLEEDRRGAELAAGALLAAALLASAFILGRLERRP